MTGIVFFGIGSPIVVEYEETCKRLGYAVVDGVRNRPGETAVSDAVTIVEVEDAGALAHRLPCVCPMFTPRNRYAAACEATALEFPFADALVDPTAIVASSTVIGAGSYVNAGCVVAAASSLAEHVVINRGASIGHHARIEAFASVGPGAVLAGHVTVGRGAMIGAGAVILPRVAIGAHAVVGAGAVVVGDVPARTKVVGNPAAIKERMLEEF
jgi:sugar O-acyltransferase (sialic acid O-acetyltransferase NeuD family)